MDLYFHSSGIGWQNTSLDIEKEMKTVETNGLGFVRMVDNTAFNWFAQQNQGQEPGQGQRQGKDRSCETYRIACITSIAGTKGSVLLLSILPPSVSRTTIWSALPSRLTYAISYRYHRYPPGFRKDRSREARTYPLQLTPRKYQQIVNAL